MKIVIDDARGVYEFWPSSAADVTLLLQVSVATKSGSRILHCGNGRFYTQGVENLVFTFTANFNSEIARLREFIERCTHGSVELMPVAEFNGDFAVFTGKFCKFCKAKMVHWRECRDGVCRKCQNGCAHVWGRHGWNRFVDRDVQPIRSCDRCNILEP